MATYDYHCRECHEWAEVDRSIHDVEQPVNCPKCENIMKRVYGPINATFKGDGFYRNDKNQKSNNFYPENGSTL